MKGNGPCWCDTRNDLELKQATIQKEPPIKLGIREALEKQDEIVMAIRECKGIER